jgi:hypothetical protein
MNDFPRKSESIVSLSIAAHISLSRSASLSGILVSSLWLYWKSKYLSKKYTKFMFDMQALCSGYLDKYLAGENSGTTYMISFKPRQQISLLLSGVDAISH